jgi:hypothetical protein
MSIRPVLWSSLFFCLCACSPGKPSASPEGIAATESGGQTVPSATPLPDTPTPAPTPAPVDRPLYRIQASLDTRLSPDGTMTLSVREQAIYTNRSGEPIGELVLQFEPARRTELFELANASADRAAPASVADGQLRIPLDSPLEPGETAALQLDYRRRVAQEDSLIGWNDYQIVLGNWYAFYPPYRDGQGWLAHVPGLVGEHLNYPYADFDIRLEIQGDETYMVAASGIPEEGEAPLHFRFTGRSFALALTTQLPFRRTTAGGVEVLGYARQKYEAQGEFMTGIASRAVEVFSERYGAYPHPRLTVLESELPDGMEFDGLVFLNPDVFPYFAGDGADYLTAITAHETAHQWWYGRVGNDQAIDPWLDEAFATYSELVFYERTYPILVPWWWWTRVEQYRPDQCVDLSIYPFAGFREYVDAVYLRGALMLHTLRLRMGNEAFEASLRELQSTAFGSVIFPEDVFRIFQSHASLPLFPVWDAFLCLPPPRG